MGGNVGDYGWHVNYRLSAGLHANRNFDIRRTMTRTQVVRYFGNIRQASKALGISRTAFYKWPNTGRLPEYAQVRVLDCLKERGDKVPDVWGLK